MHSPVHQCLDGESPAQALSTGDAARLKDLQRVIASVSSHVRAAPVPELTGRVMSGLSRPHTALPARAALAARAHVWARQLWRPRRIAFEFRPAYALGMAAAAVVFTAAPFQVPMGFPPHASTAAPPPATSAYVQFRLDAPGASQVALAGSFTDWKPRYVMQERTPGVWTAMVPVAAGVHEYLFVVDGQEWVPDPAAETVGDDFGGTNSRLLVSPPRAQT